MLKCTRVKRLGPSGTCKATRFLCRAGLSLSPGSLSAPRHAMSGVFERNVSRLDVFHGTKIGGYNPVLDDRSDFTGIQPRVG